MSKRWLALGDHPKLNITLWAAYMSQVAGSSARMWKAISLWNHHYLEVQRSNDRSWEKCNQVAVEGREEIQIPWSNQQVSKVVDNIGQPLFDAHTISCYAAAGCWLGPESSNTSPLPEPKNSFPFLHLHRKLCSQHFLEAEPSHSESQLLELLAENSDRPSSATTAEITLPRNTKELWNYLTNTSEVLYCMAAWLLNWTKKCQKRRSTFVTLFSPCQAKVIFLYLPQSIQPER